MAALSRQVSTSSSRTNKSAEAVRDLRQWILDEHEANPDLFHPKDVERVRTNDWYVKRFYLARGRNVDAALTMLRNCLIWRKDMTLPDIKDSDFPLEFYKAGGLFSYERDRKGNVMIYMRIRMHRKVPELAEPMRRFLMHMMDKVDRMTDGQGSAIVFDCTGAGISNADMDFLKFLIQSGKSYFPLGAKYILVYELPWILNAFWRAAALVVPQELMGLVRFATKKNITDLVAPENLPDYMGGTCRRNYRYVPEGCRTVKILALEYGFSQDVVDRIWPNYEKLLAESELALAQNDYVDPPASEWDTGPPTIHAPGGILPAGYKFSGPVPKEFNQRQEQGLQNQEHEDTFATPEPESGRFASLSSITSPPLSSRPSGPSGPSGLPLLKLSPPGERLEFTYNPTSRDFECTLTIYNPSERSPVAFKIQSNNPAGYTVSPRFGIILEQGALTLHLRHVNGNESRDKFLLLATPIADSKMTVAQFNGLWTHHGNNNDGVKASFKLGVRIHRESYKNGHVAGAAQEGGRRVSFQGDPSSGDQVLRGRLERLERRQRYLELTILLLVLLLFACVASVALLSGSQFPLPLTTRLTSSVSSTSSDTLRHVSNLKL